MRSIVCFGTGIDGNAFISIAENKVKIEYFLDNVQYGGVIRNYKIYKPSAENCRGKYIVVTTSKHYHSIKKQLESYGLCERVNFVSLVEFLMMNEELLESECSKNNLRFHLFIRKKKAIFLSLHQAAELPEKNDLIYETYKNAVILPLKRFSEDNRSPKGNWTLNRGGVVDQSGEYVQLSGVKNSIIGKYEYAKPHFCDERVVYCGFFIKHWGHFLVEVVARLWYFLEKDTLSEKYVFFVESEKNVALDGNYREFFRLLGILDRIEIINEPVQYREVIVPQICCSNREYYSKFYKDIFSTVVTNAMLECKEQQCYDKVYFSRSRWGKAEFGLEMMDDFFEKNGFQIVYPETLTLTQMIFMIQKADTLAAVSGTAPHNILFGKDGQELIIVERSPLNNDYQVDISRIKQLNVTYIDANMALYPVSYGGGLSLLSCNRLLRSFAEERGWSLPDRKYMSEDYIKDNIKKYQDYYHQHGRYDILRVNEELFREAYLESLKDIKSDEFDLSYMIEKIEVTVTIAAQTFQVFLKDCIQEILLQTTGVIDVFTVDGRIADDSFDMIKVIKELQKENDLRVYVRDAGCEYRSNPGISITAGKYAAILEPNVNSENGIVEKLYAAALKYDAGIIDVPCDELSAHIDKDEDAIMLIDINNCFLFKIYR